MANKTQERFLLFYIHTQHHSHISPRKLSWMQPESESKPLYCFQVTFLSSLCFNPRLTSVPLLVVLTFVFLVIFIFPYVCDFSIIPIIAGLGLLVSIFGFCQDLDFWRLFFFYYFFSALDICGVLMTAGDSNTLRLKTFDFLFDADFRTLSVRFERMTLSNLN